jgi:Leucine-rich repeat (LRR) protein
VVTIPDAAFKSALVNNPLVNTNANTEIECSEAAAYNGFLMLAAENIFDLTGLEAFVNLTGLNVSANLFNTLDVTSNVALVDLRCGYNDLTSLDISNCPSLRKLWIWNNQITSLNLADNPHLDSVDFSYNNITNIDLSANTELLSLNCGFNQITDLDLSSNILLEELYCYNNNLTSLNIQNGNNSNLIYFAANNNPNGLCVKVDDVTTMQTNWPNAIDVGSNYSVTCGPCTVFIPDANFKAALVNNPTINTNGNSEIECSEATAYTSFINVSNSNISDLTGIEAFTGITMLNCSVNQLTDLDLSTNTALTNLNCTGNNISNLNISNCLNLVELFCSVNQITSLDLSNHIYLEQILCNENALTSLNIQNGFNAILTNFLATTNPNLTCIAVDNVNDMIANWPSAIDGVTAYNLNCNVCTINIPDANFKAALLANPYINTNSNQEVECTEAASFTGSIFVLNSNIADLTGIEEFLGVTQLNCSSNQLTSLDLSANAALYFVDANFNQLTNLTLPSGSTLSDVIVSDNQLTSIDVSSNSYLSYLDCNNNNLTSLNVLSNSYVSYLFCNGNQITDLDCSNNASLIQLGCANNNLINLNIQNGNNNNLTSFDASNNPQLTCIQVDSVAGMNTNWPGAIDATASYSAACAVCTVNIPDANFKNALLSNSLINTNGDNEIQCSEAANYNGIIQVIALGITDLTGIEAFVNIVELNCAQNALSGNLDLNSNTLLTNLDCSQNQLTGLNVSACTLLYELVCAQNQITGTIDVSSMPNLYNFRCEYNQLTSIDISSNANLYSFGCGSNQLTSLDVSGNTALVHLEFENNQIASINTNNNTLLVQLICSYNLLNNLDVSNNTSLEVLYCDFNQLSNLNITNNTLLEFFNCSDNMLSTINVSNNTALYMFYCSYNQINGYLDLSNHTALGILNCSGNQLTGLNIQNGNNLFLSFFDATQNPGLTCVQVDSVALMITNWSSAIDANASYSLLCGPCIVNIPDANFKNELLSNLAINTNADNEIQCAEAAAYTNYLNVQLSNIADLTGIEAFVNIDSLNCLSNQLTSLDLTSNTSLIFLQCYGNQLSTLNLTGLTDLKVLYCYQNNLTSLDVSTNTSLILINCNANQLTTLNTSANTELISLGCGSNLLTNINLSNNPLLTSFGCGNNFITTLNLQNNPLISTLGFNQNQITSMDLSNLSLLDDLSANDNNLTYLNIQNGNNVNLQDFDATGNPNLTCVQVDDVAFMNNNFSSYIDATASYSLNCSTVCPAIPIAFSASSTSITTVPMSVTFTNSTPNLTNYDFIWYFGDGTMLSSNASSVNHTYYFNGIYSVSLVAFDNTNGCYDTLYNGNYITCNASGAFNCNHTVALNPSGLVNACAGSMVPLNGTTSISVANFQWNRNGVMIGGASQDNYLANANGNYTLTVFDGQGCPVTSSPTQINYSLQSSVAPIITATGPVNNCGNVNVTLTAVGSFSNYLWSTGQTGSSIAVTQGGSYTVIGQSPACDAISIPTLINGSNAPLPPICMVTVDETNNKNIIIWEKPVSNEIDSFIILREDIDLAGVYTIVGSQSYTDLSEFNDVSSDANARAYRYKLAVKDTCGGITIASAEQRSIHLDVVQGNSVLARQLTWNVYQGQPQAFTHYLIYRETAPGNLNLALIDSVPSTQTWYYDNTLTQLSDTARAYKIGYRITTPCVSTRAQNEICSSNVTTNDRPVVDGLNQILNNNLAFNILPNPNNGKFSIQSETNGIYQLKVFNLIGEELHQQSITNQKTEIDLSNLSNGVYYLYLFNENRRQQTKIIIAK